MIQKEQIAIWKTILVLVLASVVAYLIWPKLWLLWLGVGIGSLSLLSPQLARLIHIVWMKLAEVLGYVNSRILLGLIFFLLLSPIALLRRIFHKDPLQLKRPKDKSLFHERNH
ncbi:MAG: SxtJ family membrane protein, partial [Bacteroidota bacterium]